MTKFLVSNRTKGIWQIDKFPFAEKVILVMLKWRKIYLTSQQTNQVHARSIVNDCGR